MRPLIRDIKGRGTWRGTGSKLDLVHYDIDFEYENTGYEKVTNCELKVRLERGSLSIDQDILSTERFNSIESKKMVSKFVSLDDYEEPAIVDGQIIFKMRQD